MTEPNFDHVRFLGSGDSFGSGGRFQTCIMVSVAGRRFLVDCGASSLVAMRAQGIEPNSISAILVTHLHGDHCAGVPFFLMDAMLGSKRQQPLYIAGPPNSKARLQEMQEVLFPGSRIMVPKFPVEYVELPLRQTRYVDGMAVTAYPAVHTPETTPTMLRVETGGRIVSYTGDTDWTEDILAVAENADVLVSECYFYDKPVKMHMNYVKLKEHLGRLSAKQVVLTHMSPEMLARAESLPETCASDGLVVRM